MPSSSLTTPAPWRLLLMPRLQALRNGFRHRAQGGRFRPLVFAVVLALFWVGIFWLFHRVLDYFHTVPELGPVLSQKLLHLVFLTFFAVLLFSNVITGLSTFFLSRDLLLLIPAPVSPAQLFTAKFVETLLDSSWMVLLFSGPVFLAYGIVHESGPLYYLLAFVTLVLFLGIPAALGVIATMTLAYLLPAQRGKDMLVVFSALFLSLLYMLLRLLQPEKLVNPEAFSDLLSFLSAMRAPSSPFLPSAWAAEILLPFLQLKPEGSAGFHLLMLLSTTLFLFVVGSSLATRLYPLGWSKAQEGQRRRTLRQWWETGVAAAATVFPVHLRTMVLKDLKTFFRDTGQWSQLFMLLALVIVYVYNFSVLPVGGVGGSFYLQNVIAFFNLALAGFVLTSIAVRFVYPALSLEGKTFWVLKSAPVPLRRWWWSKFWTGVLPLLFFGELLVTVTNYFLRVSPFMATLSAVTLFFVTFGIVALGLAVGVGYPNFTAEHSAKIASSFGGVLYMVLCISFIGAVTVLEAWPVYVLFLSRLHGTPLSPAMWGGIITSLSCAFVLTVGMFWGATRWGLHRLEALEISL